MSGRKQVRAVVLAALLVLSSFSMAGVSAASPATGNDSAGNATETTFHVSQGQNCYPVTALGDGDQPVEDFYDYRNPETEPDSFNYASYGTKHLQSNQESKLFLYHGENGYSLVVLHDQFSQEDESVDGSHASTVTFTMSGMPDDGSWAVRDDNYENGTQDDNWDTSDSTHEIDWMWSPNRNDGGAFLGVEDAEITIDPGFNGEANQWGSWDYSDNPEDRMTEWKLINGDQTEQNLDMSQSLTIAQGECSDDGEPNTDPTADFSVTDDTVANDETVEFDASDSSDDGTIESYEWDFGDGNTESGETASHSYDEPGDYPVTLKVTDDDGNSATATKTVTVTDSDGDPPKDGAPSAKLSLSTQTADFNDKVGFNASAATDDDGDVVEYQWDLDGDGEIDRKTHDKANGKNNSPHTIWHDVYSVYDEPGTYTASVTVVDDDGNTDTATKKLTIEQNDHTAPNATLDVPDEVTVGEEFTVKATDFTEDKDNLKHICWTFGEEHGEADGATATYKYEETGKKTIKLHLKDKAGNSKMLKTTVTVTKADDGGDGNDGGDDGDDDDDSNDPPKNDPIDDDPNDGNKGGGIPTADPPADDSDDESNDGDQTPKKAAFGDADDNYGEIVLQSDATDALVEVTESVPDDARQATPALDGFEALSYVTVSGAEDVNATFTVSKDRLESADATPEAVTLFRFDDGSWNAVETEQLNETDDAYEFGASATNGTYAVGIGVPSTAVEDLRVAADRVAPGDSVTVTAIVENDGHASGTQDVELTVDGETVATKSVDVSAGSTEEVEFTRSFDSPGVYSVSAGDANAEIVVEGIETTTTETTTDLGTTTATETGDTDGPGVPGFGVGAALAALAAAALLARRKA